MNIGHVLGGLLVGIGLIEALILSTFLGKMRVKNSVKLHPPGSEGAQKWEKDTDTIVTMIRVGGCVIALLGLAFLLDWIRL